jgi:uncharacterized membrane protein
MNFNLTHVHLLLNHFPTIGFGIGLGVFLVALLRKSEELKQASLVIFFLIALISIPTYFSGNAAQQAIKGTAGVSESRMSQHESAALLALLFMEMTGFVAWLGLWQARRISRIASWNLPAVLVLSIITFLLMANAANIGGGIRHPEIETAAQAAGTPEPAPDAYMARAIGSFVTNDTWVWPACETLHFVGLCLLFTVVLIVDLRMLGMAKSLPFSALYQLLPFGMLGFAVNFVTGMMFFISTPEQYTKNIAFHWKIVFVMLAGINVLYFMLFDETWKVEPGVDAPVRAKVAAASAIFLWIGVLYFGHMLPFIGNSF